MAISYLEPAERAWVRTRRLLFQPFDIEKWLVIGFASFLAGLAGQWAGVSFTPKWRLGFPPDFDNLIQMPFHGLWNFFRDSYWFLFGVPFALLGLLLGLLLLWLSSRGKFIFLDGVVRERAAVVQPWKRYAKLGDSLFFWRLGFVLVTLAVFGILLSPIFLLGRGMSGTTFGRPFGAFVTLGATAASVIIGLCAAYVALFLESFVVPLMYKRGVAATEAWKAFLPLLRRHLAEFVTYGLLILLACVGVFLGLIAASILTCCILPLLLAVPYVRSVVLLPLSGLFRLYTLEFLEQFGPEYAILTKGSSLDIGQ